MARTYNQVTLVGHLGTDPLFSEVNGVPMAKFRMATNRYQGPNMDSVADWHNVVCWRNTAVAVNQYLHSGSRVHVAGPMLQNKWTTQEGRNASRIEIRGDNVIFLDNPGFSPAPAMMADTDEVAPVTDEHADFGNVDDPAFAQDFEEAMAAAAPGEVD